MYSQCLAGHPLLWDEDGVGGRRLVSGFIFIDSEPHVFQRIFPSKQTFSGSLIPITEWILAGSSLLYQFARHFHLYRGLPAVPLQSGKPKKVGGRVSESVYRCLIA